MMRIPDIYFTSFWGELNCQLENGVYEKFEYENGKGKGFYHFIKKPVPIKINDIQYYDTITPYGFNGPIIIECQEDRKKFIEEFNTEFNKFCVEHRIVAEYVRFNPWLKNHEDFKEIYNLRYNNYTLGVDLTGDFFYDQFTSKCRNQVRKAIKSNVNIEYDFKGGSIGEFYRLYNLMVEKNKVGENYRFSKDYFINTFEKCKDKVFILNAIYENKVISSAMFLQYEDFIHYHFSGNDAEFGSLCANNLLLFTAATWGKENGKKTLHLGGAFSESLFRFKQSFTKNGIFDYYVGTKIRNKEVYDELVNQKKDINLNFFPAYR